MKRKTAFILAAVVSIGIANAQTKERTHDNVPDSANIVSRSKSLMEKYNPEIDRFLNTEDDSIFTNFNYFKEERIHPRSLNFYRLITEIHHLDSIVSITGEMKASEFDKIRENINRAKTIRDSILSYADCEKGAVYYLLSEPQKEFYRKLDNQYKKLNADYNPESNHGF